jgi:sugar phosphate isomerase/epimerase
VRFRRLTREERAQRIEAQAAKFEKRAAELEEKLPADLIESEPGSAAEASKLRPSDPAWQRHAAAGLRRSASELRALAEKKRRGEW